MSVMISAPAAKAFTAQVEKVVDGDTLEIRSSHGKDRIRLWGVDSPEVGQTFGAEAKAHLEAIIAGRRIAVESKTDDRYGRIVAVLYAGETNVNEEMIRRGAAWVYDTYCTESVCKYWRDIEDQARYAKKGLWLFRSSEAPWRWRREHKGN